MSRRKEGGGWEAPALCTASIDDAVNAWVDETGFSIVNVTAPAVHTLPHDEGAGELVMVASVVVTYAQPEVAREQTDVKRRPTGRQGWEPV